MKAILHQPICLSDIDVALYLLVLNSFIIMPNILEWASKEAISFAEYAEHQVSSSFFYIRNEDILFTNSLPEMFSLFFT